MKIRMSENKGLLSSGWGMAMRNKRYIVWFWLLNLTLAVASAAVFYRQAAPVLGHSLYSEGLLRGFDLGVFSEMLMGPEFGPTAASHDAAVGFAVVFFAFNALLLPGVFQGYASTYRLPREDFFRACGRNLWRFIRLLVVAGIVMGAVARLLFSLHGLLEKKAGESTNEMLLPYVQLIGLLVIFLVMATLRIWFDLAEADVVLSDQRAVRRSIGAAFRHTWRSLGRLLTSYVVTTIVAAVILMAGIWVWRYFVPPQGIVMAFVVSQLTLLLLLIPRFWQRGVIVSYWQQNMLAPVVRSVPAAPPPVPVLAEVGPPPVAPEGA
jgi:hypothetical protein